MIYQKISRLIVVINILLLSLFSWASAEPVRTDLSSIELLSDHKAISSGSKFTVLIHLVPDQGWHAYWENPGDAGLKLTMDWDLPDGVTVGELQFTTPHLIPFEEIVTYGYESDVFIIAEVTTSDDLQNMEELTIGGNAFWLTCSDTLCVPQEASVNLMLPVGENVVDTGVSALVNAAKQDMPLLADWKSEFYTDGETFTIYSDLPDEFDVIADAYIFPFSQGMMENSYHQNLSFADGRLTGEFKSAYGYEDNATFEYVLAITNIDQKQYAYRLSADKSLVPFLEPQDVSLESSGNIFSLLLQLFFAFIGGLILNLMPCVFPILSLKAMSVIRLAEKEPAEVRLSGLLYTCGVMVCFGLIGVLVLALDATGQAVGWGFHMQLPIVNFTLGLLMVVIALNLFGIFEFGGGVSGLGQKLIKADPSDKKHMRQNSFFTGVLAVVVATPCTAPFMAGTLGFAFLQGGLSAMLIFLSLGFGLAFPYLLLCYAPGLRQILPKPGLWMENMRNVLGFPMLATAIWLFWILGNQIGVDAMALCIMAGLLLSFAIWGLKKEHLLWKVVSILALLGVLYTAKQIHSMEAQSSTISSDDELSSVDFNTDALKKLIDNKQSVFVYFTADWCITCKLNERVALSQPEVNDAFVAKNIIVMKGDWTNQNPDITRTMQKFGRIGVPLYLYFPSGTSFDNPVILPQILTPNNVVSAL
jgi:thiol:disulfide interchange protein